MNLQQKLTSIPQRENAGSRSANRFNYQQVWAFNYVLKELSKTNNFVLFMEFHDDIVILDSVTDPHRIDFYQIKTDDKKARYITPSKLAKDFDKYPTKMSIMQKLIHNYTLFGNDTNSLHVVSNKFFNFKVLKDETESTNRTSIILNEINNDNNKKIKNGMCDACWKKNNCKDECNKLIYFDVSDLDLLSYEETVLGRFVNYIHSTGYDCKLQKVKTIYHTILGEIRRINNCEKTSGKLDDLISNKSISKAEFEGWVKQLSIDSEQGDWKDIQSFLLSDGVPSSQVFKIGKEWKKYLLDSMNVDNLSLLELKNYIIEIINDIELTTSKEYLEYTLPIIRKNKYAKVYSVFYLQAMILREVYA